MQKRYKYCGQNMIIVHPVSNKPIAGRKLEPGETVVGTDMYASSSGDWEYPPFGLREKPLHSNNACWVRPEGKPLW